MGYRVDQRMELSNPIHSDLVALETHLGEEIQK
jgi:hypothetical protein